MTGTITRLFCDSSGGVIKAGRTDYVFDRGGLDDSEFDYLDVGDVVTFVAAGAELDGPRARQIHLAPESGS